MMHVQMVNQITGITATITRVAPFPSERMSTNVLPAGMMRFHPGMMSASANSAPSSSPSNPSIPSPSLSSSDATSSVPIGNPSEMPIFLRVLVEQIMRNMAASGALQVRFLQRRTHMYRSVLGASVMKNGALAQRAPTNRPAKPNILQSLPSITVSGELCQQDCPVCQDTFAEAERVARMPCGHSFHSQCLQPWLCSHNTCPTCRYELDTADEHYNQQLHAGRAKEVDVREARIKREGKNSQLSGWSAVELKQVLRGRGVDFSAALQKLDLVHLVNTSTPRPPAATAATPPLSAQAGASASSGEVAAAAAAVAVLPAEVGRGHMRRPTMDLPRMLRRLQRRAEREPLGAGESAAATRRRERREMARSGITD